MPSTSRVRVFVDADVLASPVPRTILYLARPLSDYELVYSQFVETEAERHQKAAHIPVSTLRQRWDWQIVPDAENEDIAGLSDTDDKDKPVLAAAMVARATFVVTGNVRHFGAGDLSTHSLSAVHPGLFLSHHITSETYRERYSKRSPRTALVNRANRSPSTSRRSPCTSRRCSSRTATSSGHRRSMRHTDLRRYRFAACDASAAPVASKSHRPPRPACATPAGPTPVRRRSPEPLLSRLLSRGQHQAVNPCKHWPLSTITGFPPAPRTAEHPAVSTTEHLERIQARSTERAASLDRGLGL